MSNLNWVAEKATGILFPSGYKANTIYGIVPPLAQAAGVPANAFDFAFSRASTANRTNKAGVWEEMPVDVGRLDYSGGQCPPILLEPSRTNLFLNSDLGATQTIVVVSGTVYSIYFTAGTGTITLSDAATEVLSVSDHKYSGSVTFTAASNSLVCTVAGVANEVQLEAGTYPTSYIKSESATVNRAQEYLTLPKSFQSEVTFFIDIDYDPDIKWSTTSHIFGMFVDGDTNNRLYVNLSGDGSIGVTGRVGGTLIFTTGSLIYSKQRIKVAFKVSATASKVYINGVNIPAGDELGGDVSGFNIIQPYMNYKYFLNQTVFNQVHIYDQALKDVELIELTT